MEQGKRNWSHYNMAQTNEKMLALKILNDAVDTLNIPYKYGGRGRPPVGLDDIVKHMCIKVFNNWSARRSIPDIQLARGLGYVRDTHHFNMICKYMRSSEVTPYLHRLYRTLATPLIPVERVFAMDSSGFSTQIKHWVDVRCTPREWYKFKRLHIITGVNSTIITKAVVTEGQTGDSPKFRHLLRETAKYFTVEEITADTGYLSRDNCNAAREIGAEPFIKPSKNVRKLSRGSYAWRKMMLMWFDNKELFLEHYHKRSNVESVFSSMKRKFSGNLRSKSDVGQYNEILCKVVCHNLSMLVNSTFELGIDLKFIEVD